MRDTTLDLEQFRQRHQGLCGIVEQTDAIYTVVILSVYLTSIPMACLLIYVLIMTSGVESQSIATAECLLFVASVPDRDGYGDCCSYSAEHSGNSQSCT